MKTALKFRNLLKFTKIVNLNPAIPISFKFSTYFWEIEGKHFEKYFQSTWIQLLLRGGKKCLCQMILYFSKMKILLWYHCRVVHRYENLCCSTLGLFIWRWAGPVRRAGSPRWDDFYPTFIWNFYLSSIKKFVMSLEKDCLIK